MTVRTLAARVLGTATRSLVPPHRPSRPDRLVAVVIPVSTRSQWLPEERISLRHVDHYLGRYDKFFLVPRGSLLARPGFTRVELPKRFFGSQAAHNHLLFWPPLYRTFARYEYILMYHLDSLVFSDRLEEWCRAGWDYIGAPWLPCPDTPWVQAPAVGNGGFTLMRVDRVLEVLTCRYRRRPVTFWADWFTRHASFTGPLVGLIERLDPGPSRWPLVARVLEHWRVAQSPALHGYNNDIFWSNDARRYVPSFKVAPVDEAMRFAFEAAPRLCFEMTGGQFPFGCHAWEKFDRAFWEPHLLPEQAGEPLGA